MKKKMISSIIMGAAMVSACTYSSLYAAASAEEFTYKYTPDGTGINITGYTGTDAEMVIPDTIEGLPVKLISTNAFKGNLTITSAKLPDTVTAIGTEAFGGCENLKAINLPSSLTSLYEYAFTECHALESVTFGDNITSIGEYAFQLCTSLAEISVPGTVETISGHTFQSCKSMERITFEEGIKVIESDAMLNAYSIERIYLPSTIVSIGEHALGYSYYSPDYTALSPVIFGYKGTAAEEYANTCGFEFYPFNKGDVNGSGDITPADAASVLSEYANTSTGGTASFTQDQLTLGDINNDGKVTPTDASEILSCYAYRATGGTAHACDYFYGL